IFVSATGDHSVLNAAHFNLMKHGAILCNSGHFDVEIDLAYLNDSAAKLERNVTHNVDAYHLKNGRVIYVLGQGRLVNLACAEGHPAQVMDMSFATQAMASHWVATSKPLPIAVHNVPQAIEDEVASLKLAAMGIKIDTLTEEQKKYLSSWQTGT
ncbi:MAG: adenosylhomocysteinase, partial [Candidatus Binataceae bacterium]